MTYAAHKLFKGGGYSYKGVSNAALQFRRTSAPTPARCGHLQAPTIRSLLSLIWRQSAALGGHWQLSLEVFHKKKLKQQWLHIYMTLVVLFPPLAAYGAIWCLVVCRAVLLVLPRNFKVQRKVGVGVSGVSQCRKKCIRLNCYQIKIFYLPFKCKKG